MSTDASWHLFPETHKEFTMEFDIYAGIWVQPIGPHPVARRAMHKGQESLPKRAMPKRAL